VESQRQAGRRGVVTGGPRRIGHAAGPAHHHRRFDSPERVGGRPGRGTYPPAGTYDLGSPPTIYDAGGLKVTWTRSQVYPYSTVPNLWYVELTYLNTGAATQHFTCTGWTDPGKARQYLYRGGSLVGSDGATETMCSSSPNWTIDLPAGNSFVSWAKFGTVPQSGDSVALEWGSSAARQPSRRTPKGRAGRGWVRRTDGSDARSGSETRSRTEIRRTGRLHPA